MTARRVAAQRLSRSELSAFMRRAGWAVTTAVDPAGTDVSVSTRTAAFVSASVGAGGVE